MQVTRYSYPVRKNDMTRRYSVTIPGHGGKQMPMSRRWHKGQYTTLATHSSIEQYISAQFTVTWCRKPIHLNRNTV